MNPWQLKKRDAGLCISCGKRPLAKENKNYCDLCRERNRLACRKRWLAHGFRKTDRVYGQTRALILAYARAHQEFTTTQIAAACGLTQIQANSNCGAMFRCGSLLRVRKGSWHKHLHIPAAYKLNPKMARPNPQSAIRDPQ